MKQQKTEGPLFTFETKDDVMGLAIGAKDSELTKFIANMLDLIRTVATGDKPDASVDVSLRDVQVAITNPAIVPPLLGGYLRECALLCKDDAETRLLFVTGLEFLLIPVIEEIKRDIMATGMNDSGAVTINQNPELMS